MGTGRRNTLIWIFLFSLLEETYFQLTTASSNINVEPDPRGYIAYCPCMGRFGNQADQFLGTLKFAKTLNRTLLLPPWIEYIPFEVGSIRVPFERYFKVDVVGRYHRVVTMESFMENMAPTVWPLEKRFSFCYMERGPERKGCDAKDGNPFGPFWDHFNVDFRGSEIFGPHLQYTKINVSPSGLTDWEEKYPADIWPVLAFVGPPGSFPVEEENVDLQVYLEWQDSIDNEAKKFISTLPKGPFIGVHLRNGADWSRVCELVDQTKQLFASPQCLGYKNEHGTLSHEMCFPSFNTITKQLIRTIKKTQATSIFVASDRNHLVSDLSSALAKYRVVVTKLNYDSPQVDLAILGRSNLFIGNCVSSFSSFVKRSRDVFGFPTEYWGFDSNVGEDVSARNRSQNHEEL